MEKRNGRWKRPTLILLGGGFLLCGLLLLLVDYRLRPLVEDMASHQARSASVRAINTAMASALHSTRRTEEGGIIAYEDLVRVQEDYQGQVSSLQSNMLLINELKLRVTEEIMAELGQEENQKISLALGTVSGIQVAAGKGPLLHIGIRPGGYAQTRIYNEFSAAGINQTLHRIMLEAGVDMMVLLPGRTVGVQTVTSYCIAETVIVGRVPSGYTDINGDQSDMIAQINDYGNARTP